MTTITISSLEDLKSAASEFLSKIGDNKVIAFYGQMGVGKTTFIKEICSLLKVNGIVNSPSFAIINEYQTIEENTIYHFDCYRLKNYDEAMNIGIEEYFYSNSFCFIEWPEKIEEILPPNCLTVKFTKNENEGRTISF